MTMARIDSRISTILGPSILANITLYMETRTARKNRYGPSPIFRLVLCWRILHRNDTNDTLASGVLIMMAQSICPLYTAAAPRYVLCTYMLQHRPSNIIRSCAEILSLLSLHHLMDLSFMTHFPM